MATRKYLIEEIDWDTKTYWNELPKSLFVWVDGGEEDENEERMDDENSMLTADWLTDNFGFCINCAAVKEVPFEDDGAPGEYMILSEYKK